MIQNAQAPTYHEIGVNSVMNEPGGEEMMVLIKQITTMSFQITNMANKANQIRKALAFTETSTPPPIQQQKQQQHQKSKIINNKKNNNNNSNQGNQNPAEISSNTSTGKEASYAKVANQAARINLKKVRRTKKKAEPLLCRTLHESSEK